MKEECNEDNQGNGGVGLVGVVIGLWWGKFGNGQNASVSSRMQ